MKSLCALLSICVFTIGCGSSSSPTAATPVATTPVVATPSTFTLNGTVTSTTGAAISGATVRVADGPNAGKSTTSSGTGAYSMTGLAVSGMTVTASATNYIATSNGVTLTSSQALDFRLTPTPLFVQSGVGDSVFTIPSSVSRIRIQATPNTSCQNFAVQIAGRLIVNVILGTCSVADTRTHDGTYLTSGGVTQITISSGVSWTFTEQR